MKKLTILLALFLAFGLLNNCALAKNDTQKEIKKFISDYNKVLKKNDLQTLSRFYDINYKSSDGYNLSELLSMIAKTAQAFDDIKYKTKITQIDTRNDNAAVQLSDVTKARVYPKEKTKNRNKIGFLEGKSNTIMYLKKEDGMWKILQDSILSEETILKYGVARKVKITLNTPENIENGQDYGVTLNLKTPQKLIALGSISREEVNSPEKYDEKFRRISKSGQLERLVKANSNNKDEYAIASVGFTKVLLNNKQKKAKIELLGLAYMMKRVNMTHFEPIEEKILNENLVQDIKNEAKLEKISKTEIKK